MRNFTPYHELIKKNYTKNKKFKNLNIFTIFDFNPLLINAYLEEHLVKRNFNPNIISSNYDQIFQEVYNLTNKCNIKKIDLIILGSEINSKLSLKEKELNFYLKNLLEIIEKLLKFSQRNKSIELIFWNLNQLKSSYYNLKNKITSNEKKINFFNHKLFELSQKNKNLNILDMNKISNFVGFNNIYDNSNYYKSKITFTEKASDEFAYELSNIVKTIYEPTKKCLVLDLDNTLWGGVLGEDGIEGIKLGNSFKGEKFRDFQRYILSLKARGILLAIASKNNITDVKECFKKHPDMVLKLDDFSVIKANWKPKFENLSEISVELNIGKDAIVFFDDSNFERAQMQKFNPEINTIEVPNDVSLYIDAIESTAFFHQRIQTKEDKKKLYQYKILEKAQKLRVKSDDINEFYSKLSMKLEMQSINKINFDRSVQMINKTNQFNLTTKRYSSAELKNFLSNKENLGFVARLEDKFGDHGLTALAMIKIVDKNKKIYFLENFLLSCRILGRNIENIFLNEILNYLKNKKISALKANYIKSKKNVICKNFLKDRNFSKKNGQYAVDLSNFIYEKNKYIKIENEY